jgi:AAA15 family ATPase/GTPase
LKKRLNYRFFAEKFTKKVMLLEFKIANFRSIGEEQVISLLPAPKQKDFPENILLNGKQEALNALAFYGANASGKSNLLLAMSHLDRLLHLSARFSSTTKLPYDPFLLRAGYEKKPTHFEITFIADNRRYRFGLEFFEQEVSSEWLYRKEKGREVPLFLRERDEVETFSSLKGNAKIVQAAIESTKPNGLFLSACDTFNLEDAKIIFKWFQHFSVINALRTEDKMPETLSLWRDDAYRDKIEAFLLRLNLGFVGMEVQEKNFDANDLPVNMDEQMKAVISQQLSGKKGFSVWAKHRMYDTDGKPTEQILSWKMGERESAGTNNMVQFSGPVLWTLLHGGVLIIDEIEAKKHPHLTLDLIDAFLKKETNPHGAQLIFSTHDSNLLTYSNLRRDQIYFVEKNHWESTEIYSLSDFRYLDGNGLKERPDRDKEKRYLEGRYGAVPVLKPQIVVFNGKEN